MTTATITNNTIKVTTTYSLSELWESLVGCDFANTNYWISKIRLDTWDSPCDLRITHLKEDESGVKTTVVSKRKLVVAFAKLLQNNQTHCGGYSLSDFENADACLADLVLQQAIFDDVIFG